MSTFVSCLLEIVRRRKPAFSGSFFVFFQQLCVYFAMRSVAMAHAFWYCSHETFSTYLECISRVFARYLWHWSAA